MTFACTPPWRLALAAAALTLTLTLAVFAAGVGGPVAAQASDRPNIVVIQTDDQRYDDLRAMPQVRALLADRGTSFSNAFATYPLCCPSRATLLTGQYAHNHGVLSNTPPNGGYGRLDHGNVLPVWLQQAGYRTIHVGKYLNGYTRSPDVGSKPPGWSEWYTLIKHTYYDFSLNENGGRPRPYRGRANYQTDVLTQKAVDRISAAAAEREPFFLSVDYVAPHVERQQGPSNPRPAARHAGHFANEPLPRSRAFDEANMSDKPVRLQRQRRLTRSDVAELTKQHRDRLTSLLAVDEGIGRIMRTLNNADALEDTLVIFISDNGFMLGEHRIRGRKIEAYEESIRVPLLMRGPGVPSGRRVRDLVGNIDVAATILDVANVRPGRRMDGRSLLPLVRDPGDPFERDIVIEAQESAGRRYTGLRTERFVYIQHASGEREVYDLRRDPDQLRNIVRRRSARRVVRELRRRFIARRDCRGSACRRGMRLRLRVSCRGGAARLSLRGGDLPGVETVRFAAQGGRSRTDRRGPFVMRVRVPRGAGRVVARVGMIDGKRLRVERRLRGC